MDKKIKKVNRISSYICIGIMLIMFLSIILRVFSRQILVEKLGMDNFFTRLVFFDSSRLQSEETNSNEKKTDWEALYPFEDDSIETAVAEMVPDVISDESPYIRLVDSVKVKIEDYSTKFLMGHDSAANMAATYDKLLQWETPVSPKDFSRIIKMENGYLTYVQPRIESQEIDKMVDSIASFDQFLEERNIPLLVINSGSKVNPEDTQLSAFESQFEHTNANGDELMGKLQEAGIETLDIRKVMLDEGLDWYKCYYKTDHHLTTNAGLFLAGKIAEKLNSFNKCDFDLSLFDSSNYELTTYKNIMFGGQGRAVTRAKASLEDYTCILPSFDTNLEVKMLEEGWTYEGSYENALYSLDKLEAVKNYSGSDFLTQNDAYGTIRLFNTPVTQIKNKKPYCNQNLKIMFIEDSFSWYSTSFLALGAGQTDIIYPISFTGSIRKYVEENKPDIVVFSFCQKAIDPIDYSTHSTYFDLR